MSKSMFRWNNKHKVFKSKKYMSKKTIFDLSTIQDSLVIHYGGQYSKIDSYTFANSLIALTEVIDRINTYLEPAQRITVQIDALSSGSFRAKITQSYKSIITLFSNLGTNIKEKPLNALSVLVAIFATNTIATFSNNHNQIIVKENNIELHINETILLMDKRALDTCNDLLKDNQVEKSLKKNFKVLQKDEQISDFSLFQSFESDTPLYQANRDEFEALINRENVDTKEIEETTDLTIFAPVLAKTKRKWEFVWHGNPISAYMKDDVFYTKMHKRLISFKQGDIIKVKLKIKQKLDADSGMYLNDSYEVLEVLNDPESQDGASQLKLNT